MQQRHILYLLVLSCVVSSRTTAQEIDLRFGHLSVNEGLSQSTVYSIAEDYPGFLWFGTRDGLNRYDGAEFKVYRSDGDSGQGLSHVTVRALIADSTRCLWIGTDGGGLNRFDFATQSFTHFHHDSTNPQTLSSNNILSLVRDRQDRLWIGTRDGGLNCLQGDRNDFLRIDTFSASLAIWSLAEHTDGTIWAATDDGLHRFDGAAITATYLRGMRVTSILVVSETEIWAGTEGRGLAKVNARTGIVRQFLASTGSSEGLSTNRISSLALDKMQNLWVGTFDQGLFLRRKGEDRFRRYAHHPLQPSGLADNSIRSLSIDRAGTLWIGTNGRGLHSYSPLRHKFRHIRRNPLSTNTLSDDAVHAIHEDREGNLWIGTDGGGLNILDRQTGQYHVLNASGPPGKQLSNDIVITLLRDRTGTMWVGTDGGGLERWGSTHAREAHFRHRPDDPLSLSDDHVLTLHQDRAGALWVGTYDGLNVLDPSAGTFAHYKHDPVNSGSISDNRILSILEDRSGTIWVGTHAGGLNRFDRATGLFSRVNFAGLKGISHIIQRVVTLFEDASGILWVGTMDGVVRFDPRDGSHAYFDETNGLANRNIRAILGDRHGRIWFSAFRGISMLDPRTGLIQNFGINEGSSSAEFIGGSAYQNDEGYFFFGSSNGYFVFHPDSVRLNLTSPPIAVTQILVAGQPRAFNPYRAPADPLLLPSNENFFTIGFTALDFLEPTANQFTYILEGFDKEWSKPGPTRRAVYTNVSPGSYVFRVKGSNHDGFWNESGATLFITVLPPWWETWFFRATVFLLMFGLLYGMYRYRVKKILELQTVRLRIASDLHDEIGSNLSSISVASQLLNRNPRLAPDEHRKLLDIASTAMETADAMRDIVWFINPENDTAEDFLAKLRDVTGKLLGAMEVELEISESVLSHIKSLEDRRNLFLLYKEALNNIARHSRARGVSIQFREEGGTLVLRIRDEGVGFDEQAVSRKGGLQTMRKRAQLLNSTLEIESAAGRGTTLIITKKIP
ncbi:MAG: hypothetical protein HYZ01_07530 [Ignavibacteriales bacterium]|nr:hypothetical protein [Ignavibacteriales bacterium]